MVAQQTDADPIQARGAAQVAEVDNRMVVAAGTLFRIASVQDEEVVEGEIVSDPKIFLSKLRHSDLKADVFTFAEKPGCSRPAFDFPFDFDNVAAAPTTSYSEWWEKRLPQESRKNVRRSAKKGIVVKRVAFNDAFVAGVQQIYNRTPFRQGKRFWHFNKSFLAVKEQLETYLPRSRFIGAYYGEDLVGFLKMVLVDDMATIFHILALDEHSGRRPINALIAHAVKTCEEERLSYLIYGKMTYGNKRSSSLAVFKRRNGFEQIDFPRYYIPLTGRGHAFVNLKLYRGLLGWVPEGAIEVGLSLRRGWCRLSSFANAFRRQGGSQNSNAPSL